MFESSETQKTSSILKSKVNPRPLESALRVLESFASFGLTALFAFDFSGVSCQKAFGAHNTAVFFFEFNKRASQGVTRGFGLAGEATADYLEDEIISLGGFDEFQRGENGKLFVFGAVKILLDSF